MPMKNLRAPLLVVLLVALLPVGVFCARYLAASSACPGEAPEVPTFAGSNLRPGALPACLSGHWSVLAGTRRLGNDLGLLRASPLYLDTRTGSWPEALRGKRLLVAHAVSGLKVLDLDEGRVVLERAWPLPAGDPPGVNSSSSPVFDPATLSIYGLVVSGSHANRNHLYRYSLRDGGFEWRRLSLSPLLSKSPAARAGLERLLICRTAMGLQRQAHGTRLFFGCSFDRGMQKSFTGHLPGLRAGLFVASLPADGSITEAALSAFTPASTSAGGKEGIDGSLWSSGSGIAALGDGSYLLATGNAPYEPERGNLGCSVVRVREGENGKLEALGHLYRPLSAENDDGDLCRKWDMDLASSAVASVEHGGKIFSVVTGKDGVLKSFDPFALPGKGKLGAAEHVVSGKLGHAFGQPLIWADSGRVHVRSVARQPEGGWALHAFEVNPDHTLRLLWERKFAGRLPNSSVAAGFLPGSGGDGVLAVPALDERDGYTRLFLVSAASGELVGEQLLEGVSHFSMPLVVGDRFFVPNSSGNLHEVRLRFSFLAGLRRSLVRVIP